jgi:hypothetical protein
VNARQALDVLAHRIADLEAENAGLQSELDGYRGHAVYLCMRRDMDSNAIALIGEPPGTVLRSTDLPYTEWVLSEQHSWAERVRT